jgi:hypothetical protein
LFEGTYYLTQIDDKYKRSYALKEVTTGLKETRALESAKTSSVDAQPPAAVRLNAMKMQLLAASSSS